MKERLIGIILVATVFGLIWVSSINPAFSITQASTLDFKRTLTFDVQHGQFRSTHNVHVSVPESLYRYYDSKSHFVSSDNDYAKYVTPTVFESIADNIRKTTNNTPYSEEQFANAVLSLVRQIPYNKSNVKYPVEALVENSGDCDVLSLLAASIMKAGGLDIVLFHYKGINPSHMNIGVYLPYKPVYRAWWTNPTGFEYNNKTYWVGETTSLSQWKVGEKPDLLTNSKAYIIPLNSSQKSSPGQVSSSLDGPLPPSAISIAISSDESNQTGNTRSLSISGSISPPLPNKTVTIYTTQGKTIQTIKAITDESGNYSQNWNFTTTSTYQIQASFTDVSDFAGSESEALTIFGSYRPLVTETGTEYYTWGGSSAAGFGYFINQGAKEFLRGNVSGTGAILSGEFIVLDNNETDSLNEPIVIPETEHIVSYSRGRPPIKVIIPEVTLPPLLPDGQFGFILAQNGDNNYSASVKILADLDIIRIAAQLGEEGAAFMNASQITKENTWYKITATMSETSTSATLFEENGVPLDNISTRIGSASANNIGVLLAYDPGAVIAFKNLKVKTFETFESPVSNAQGLENGTGVFIPFIELVVVLVMVLLVIAIAKRKLNGK